MVRNNHSIFVLNFYKFNHYRPQHTLNNRVTLFKSHFNQDLQHLTVCLICHFNPTQFSSHESSIKPCKIQRSFPPSMIDYVLIFYQVSNFTFLFDFIPGLDIENGVCLFMWFVGLTKGLQTTNQIEVIRGLAIRDQGSDCHR